MKRSRPQDTAPDERQFILKLSDACSKHGLTHSSGRGSEEDMPERCRRDLNVLIKILPRVEESLSVDKHPHASDVAHLCDFYLSVIQGNFCPHAPLLLDWGKQGKEVLPRVFSLFQHLQSKSILNDAEGVATNTICTTISHLLVFIPGQAMQESVVHDLINLASDFGELVDLNVSNQVQVTLFGEALLESKLPYKFDLQIPNTDTTFLLWSCAFDILLKFLSKSKSRLFQAAATEEQEAVGMESLSCASIWAIVLDDGDLLSTVLESIRKALLCTKTTTRTDLVVRTKVAAAKLLVSLVTDWHVSLPPLGTVLMETTVCISQAIRVLFRQQDETAEHDDEELSRLLATLLQKTVLFPPKAGGGGTEMEKKIRAATLPTLLECVPFLQKTHVALARVVLRTIHASLCTDSVSFAGLHHCGIVPSFFQLLDTDFKDIVLRILSALLFSHHGTDFTNICRLVYKTHEKQKAPAASAPVAAVASNKKRRSSQVSPYRPQALPVAVGPSPKRQRTSSGANASGTTTFSPFGSTDQHDGALGNALYKAVMHASRLTQMVDPCRVLCRGQNTLDSTEMTAKEICDAIVSIAGVHRLVVDFLSQKHCEDAMKVCTLLSKALKAVAMSLSSHWKNLAQVSVEINLVVDSVVKAGLHAQFCCTIQQGALDDCLDAIAHLARDIWSTSNSVSENASACGTEARPSCCGICQEFNKALCVGVGTKEDLCCFCGLLQIPDTLKSSSLSSGRSENFQSDCAMMLFETLPRHAICALLSCLRPLGVREDVESTLKTHPVAALLNAAPSQGPSTMPISLALSPAFMLSLAVTSLKRVDANENSSQNQPQTVADNLSRHVASCLARVQYRKYTAAVAAASGSNHVMSAAAYSSMYRLFELMDLTLRVGPDKGLDEYCQDITKIFESPQGVLAFMLGRRFDLDEYLLPHAARRRARDSPFDTLQETDRSSRIALLSTPFDELDENCPAYVLIARWQCISAACRHSTVHELSAIKCSPEARTVGDSSLNAGQDRMIEEPSSRSMSKTSLLWLLRSPFSSTSKDFRDVASREVGQVMLENRASVLYALFSTPSQWRQESVAPRFEVCEADIQCPAAEVVVAPLFQEIDQLLCRYCSVPQSQLSFTVANSYTASTESRYPTASSALKGNMAKALTFQKSAIMALSSLCQHVDVGSRYGLLIFEQAMSRLVRFWITNAVDQEQSTTGNASDTVSISALAFREMARLDRIRPLQSILLKMSFERFVPRLFSDVLLPGAAMASAQVDTAALVGVERESRERQFRYLLTFIGAFFASPPSDPHSFGTKATVYGSFNVHHVLEFLDQALPSVISAFVTEKDYDSLLLVTGFKLFLLTEERKIKKLVKKASTHGAEGGHLCDELLGSSPRTAVSASKLPGAGSSRKELMEQTKMVCLAPDMVEQILPRILMNHDRSQLVFFLDVVLKRKMSLQQMITSRDQPVLKGILWELGRFAEFGTCDQAIRTAARAREHGALTGLSEDSRDHGSAGSNRQEDDNDAASKWVTSNFMYLLVNVVQHRWNARSSSDRIRALRCLRWMVKYLCPLAAPQYLPQIMATINVVMSADPDPSNESEYSMWKLRLLAVQSLSEFIRTATQCQYETVGENLASIVVCLFPVLDLGAFANSTVGDDIASAAQNAAVDLLEFLTLETLGAHLAPYFHDIPFLPNTTALDNVRAALKSHGVDFDNLLVLTSSQNTQHAVSARESLTSDGASNDDNGKGALSSRAQSALKKRLHVIRRLFSHENVSVRRVALQHLCDLLRANRGLFQRLVESEEGTLSSNFVTVSYKSNSEDSHGSLAMLVDELLHRCHTEVDPQTKLLLATCWGEVGAIDFLRIGEMSTSVSVRAEKSGEDLARWRLSQSPWHSQPVRYELMVVARHLVVALKAAPTSGDQHKIAFTIQQILVLLDEWARSGHGADSKGAAVRRTSSGDASRGQMNDWLKERLMKNGVLEMVEPYWSSKFNEVESFSSRDPPFFRSAVSYFSWLSCWCRYMLKRSHDDGRNQWCSFFYACRTAVRSQAGISLAEFILPLLILDRVCFGNGNDERVVIQEILDAFDFGDAFSEGSVHRASSSNKNQNSWKSRMSLADRQKAVNVVFMVLDTLQYWFETETEDQYRVSKASSGSRSARSSSGVDASLESTCWLWEESSFAIENLLRAIPLSLQADAAASVGMHAKALRLMEMAARSKIVQTVYDNEVLDTTDVKNESGQDANARFQTDVDSYLVDGMDLCLFNKVLGHLNDCETMEGLQKTSDAASSASIVHIKVKEAKGDWGGAMNDYERALQMSGFSAARPELIRGSLRCLLETGQLESVLHQVNGIVEEARQQNCMLPDTSHDSSPWGKTQVAPFAVEASWRLGRWSTLDRILDDASLGNPGQSGFDPDDLYQVSLGKAIHGLYNKAEVVVTASIKTAREALMEGLSNVARDNYSRSYSYLVRLHCLREVENACSVLCCEDEQKDSPRLEELAWSCSREGWNWEGRLSLVSSVGISPIVDVRLALARLAGDPRLEASLFLTVGKKARKNGHLHVAANFLAQAEACCRRSKSRSSLSSSSVVHLDDLLGSIQLQFAKLKHLSGESSAALRILGVENVAGLVDKDGKLLRSVAVNRERDATSEVGAYRGDEAASLDRFSRRLLQSTQWMVDCGLKGGSEVTERFKIVQQLSPKWGKGHFQFAKYVDTVLESRITALVDSEAGSRSMDDDTARCLVMLRDTSSQQYLLLAMEQYVNALVFNTKHVYQALPRLLSLWFSYTSVKGTERSQQKATLYQNDANDLISKNIRSIPSHSFYTAMPQLVSRVGHQNQDTAMVVRAVLTRILTKHPGQAMWGLAWLRHSASSERVRIGEEIFSGAQASLSKRKENKSLALLATSKGLFRFLIDLAKFEPKESSARSLNVRPWKGDVELSEFTPPVQAALSVCRRDGNNNGAAEAFPAAVPRMRAFCPKVAVMTSKAKPKRIKAFVAPQEQSPFRGSRSSDDESQPSDMGELHFLVKQEARGDLRKDARVQDFNNVVNRLLATTSGVGGSNRSRRRLQLKTFAVTCLSEGCGILEWVPKTEPMRNLIAKSYNPQASPFSVRRRGRYLTNTIGDPSFRNAFEKCQSMFFQDGDLTTATTMFEEIMKQYPPLLYWWFVQKFQDPHAWYEARTRFTLSSAAWSAVGHVIGLGDRHTENILVETTSGQCVHVDFDCIFDKGLSLPKPEVVPFRLTANMVDAFGPIGADGIYKQSLKAAMSTLRDNRDTLLSVLEPFLKDPIIDWKKQRNSQTRKSKSAPQSSLEAKRSIKVIDERLRGIYNLRNPNLKKVKRTDGRSVDQDDEMTHSLPLSVEGQVHKMITEATSHENLVQLYYGWMPHL